MTVPVRFVGTPTGPIVFVPQFGREVATFEEEPGGKTEALKWHVPLEFRGEFRATDLADYKPEKTYRTDHLGYLLCYGSIKSGTRKCKNRAVNRFSRCEMHGGRLHPLDKILDEKKDAEAKELPPESKSRYRQFLAGQIGVEDLDDEELASCSFRGSNGRLYKPKQVPREMAQAFTKAIFERAQAEMRSHTVTAAKTMAEIMIDKQNDPEVRLKAAKELLERNLGRTPQVVAITSSAPWEEIFDGIASGTRESSRKRRAISSERADIIDVETTGDTSGLDEQDSVAPDGKGDNGFDDDSGKDSNERNAANPAMSQGFGPETQDSNESSRDSRHFDRNPAILAQTLELPPIPNNVVTVTPSEFDPPRELRTPLKRQRIKGKDGITRIRHVLHIYNKEFMLVTEMLRREGESLNPNGIQN